MDLLPQFTSTTRADSQGAWSMDTGESLSPGYHQVIVTDEAGQQSVSPLFLEKGEELFVIRDQPQWLDRIQFVLPPVYAYVILGLAILLAAVTLFLLWLGGKADRAVPGAKRRFKRYAIVFVVTVLAASAGLAVFLNRRVQETPVALPAESSAALPTATSTVAVHGTVVAPETRAPVSGVDLSVGDTSVKTGPGGQYAFAAVALGGSVRVNHPSLHRAILYRIDAGGDQTLIFEPELLNVVSDAVDQEARGRSAGAVFDAGNVNDQAVTVGQMRYEPVWDSPVSKSGYHRVFFVEVWNGARHETLIFSKESGTWKAIR